MLEIWLENRNLDRTKDHKILPFLETTLSLKSEIWLDSKIILSYNFQKIGMSSSSLHAEITNTMSFTYKEL